MSEVKRWNVESDEQDGPCSLWNVESAEGEFVKYEDYAALKEQFDFKQNLTEQVVALQKQRDALAAENAVLKDLQPTKEMIVAAHQELEEYDNIQLDDDAVVFTWQAMRGRQKTPAVDAYLNSVRAEGADAVARRLRRAIPLFKTIHAGAVGECSDIAEILSAQLRAGEPS